MRVNIYNGQGIVSIYDGPGSCCFRLKKPRVASWSKPIGTVMYYLTLLPYDKTEREEIHARLDYRLANGFIGNSWDGKWKVLKNFLYPLYPIFPKGEYEINYRYHHDHFVVKFAEEYTYAADAEKIRSAHQAYLKKHADKPTQHLHNLLDYSTKYYWGGSNTPLMATQAKEDIDWERVAWYEEKINNGERPFAILYNIGCRDSCNTTYNYIIDGHHKLLAYQNLKIDPPYIEFSQLSPTENEMVFDMEELCTALYPWQAERVQSYCDNHTVASRYYTNNHREGYLKLIAGTARDYYANGQLTHEVTYVDNEAEGLARFWYENGQLKHEAHYKKGLIDGEAKWWYENGQCWEQAFLRDGRHYADNTKWFESGELAGKWTKETIWNSGYTMVRE